MSIKKAIFYISGGLFFCFVVCFICLIFYVKSFVNDSLDIVLSIIFLSDKRNDVIFTDPSSKSKVNMNPYPLFSKEAESLKYPPGIDTVIYWGNGRFQIVLHGFYDEESEDKCVFKNIGALRIEQGKVFIKGQGEYFLFDVNQSSYRKFNSIDEIPRQYLEKFMKLNNKKDKKILFL